MIGMTRTHSLRTRTDADLARCVDALRAAHDIDGYPDTWPEDAASWLTPAEFVGAWVAVDGGEVLGHIAVVSDDTSELSVTRLFVTPAAQRRGVASALLMAAVGHARNEQRQLSLDVVDVSTAAIALYEKLGWRLVDVRPASWVMTNGRRPVERRYVHPAG